MENNNNLNLKRKLQDINSTYDDKEEEYSTESESEQELLQEQAQLELEQIEADLEQEHSRKHNPRHAKSNSIVDIDRSFSRNYGLLPTNVLGMCFSFIRIHHSIHFKLVNKNWNIASKQAHSISSVW